VALAIEADVEAQLGRTLTSAETAQITSLLENASDLVIGYCRDDFEPYPHPDTVTRVVAGVAARALLAGNSPDPFAQQMSAGPFASTRTSGAASGDVWLTAADKIKLRRFRKGGGLTSVQFVGERYEISDS